MRTDPLPACPPGHCPCRYQHGARGPADIFAFECHGQPAHGRLHHVPQGNESPGGRGFRDGAGDVSHFTGTGPSAGRHPVRRRAADAGHWPGIDGTAPVAGAGRAFHGPCPENRGDDFPGDHHVAGQRGNHSAGGTERPGRIEDCRSRVCAGNGQDGAPGQCGRAAGGRRCQTGLSGPGLWGFLRWEGSIMLLDMTVEEKNQLKLERLQSTLNRAYKNVPFHRNRFRERQILPADIVDLKDLQGLPFMERSHLGTHYPYGLFAVPLRDIVRIHTAPGTGARPSISGYTRADLLIWKKLISRSFAAAGVTPMDIIQIHLPPGLANWGRDYKDGGEAMGAGVIPNSPLSLAKTLMVLRDYKTTTLVTTPAFVRQLMAHMFDQERHPNELNLKRIILVGEPVDGATVADLEEGLHVDVWRNYGLSEIPGPAIAHECGSRGDTGVLRRPFRFAHQR